MTEVNWEQRQRESPASIKDNNNSTNTMNPSMAVSKQALNLGVSPSASLSGDSKASRGDARGITGFGKR